MSEPPYRRVAAALLLLLILSLALAAFYLTVIRPPGLPFPWESALQQL